MAVFHRLQSASSTEPSRSPRDISPTSSSESREALPLHVSLPASPVPGAEPAPLPKVEPTVVPTARAPRRTLFAVTLQLSRFFGALCALVRAGFERAGSTIALNSLMIADGILFGARDRSRDKFLRPLYDQQQRSESLRNPRPARPRALTRSKPHSSGKGKPA